MVDGMMWIYIYRESVMMMMMMMTIINEDDKEASSDVVREMRDETSSRS